MSNRLTTKWTDNSEGAFGASGRKGDQGEDFLMSVFKSWGWSATCHRGIQSKSQQVRGVDITFKKPTWHNSYSCDVKANLQDNGMFYVETDSGGWLFNPNKTSDRIWHVNPKTGWMAWYDRKEMQNYVKKQNRCNTELLGISVQNKIPFITRRRVNIVDNNEQIQEDDIPF